MSDVASLLTKEAERREITLEVLPGPRNIIVSGDRIEIGQVLINLALNAMDAVAEESGKRRSIQMLIDRVGNQAVISVRDRGHGITPEQFPQLFRSFFTSRSGGLGLGLSIVRTIVEAHGGRVWAEKGLKEGAAFIVELPMTLTWKSRRRRQHDRGAVNLHRGGRRIDPRVSQRLLGKAGYEARAYGSTGEFLLDSLPDRSGCLLLDLRLPGPPAWNCRQLSGVGTSNCRWSS